MQWSFKMPKDILGIRFAFNVALATAIVWYSLKYIADASPYNAFICPWRLHREWDI